MKNFLKLITLLTSSCMILASCEGPMGMTGKDANETCKECHNPEVVDKIAVEYAFSKHEYGEAAFEEAGNTGCTPCHTSDAFKHVSANNTPATFTLNATTGKYSNDYVSIGSSTLGELTCFTCHPNLHTTFAFSDFKPLTNTAPVAMTMWKGEKTINLTQDEGMSNLCVKCHQPRPLTTSGSLSNGDIVDYASLVTNPTGIFYNSTVGNAAPNKVIPSYRTHVHYGTVGAIFAGQGGVQFSGSQTYTNSPHTANASCQDCHMAPVTARAGGHTFRVRSGEGALTSSTVWNFNGCNTTDCHSANPISATTTATWTAVRADVKTLLNTLATKINSVGGATAILHTNSNGEENLWAGLTTGNYDGYLNIYDPSTNPLGVWRNPAPSNSWTQAQKDTNTALTIFPTLTNVVMGSMINFQMCLREYSLGIHNYKYSKALLQNSIDALTAAGI